MARLSKDPEEWLRDHRRLVGGLIFLAFVALLAVRFLLLWESGDSLSKYSSTAIDSIVSAAIVGLVLALFGWFSAPPMKEGQLPRIVPSREISDVTRSQAEHANSWFFVGHSARFVRSQVIPRIGDHARRKQVQKRVRLLLLDPNDESLCSHYSDYRCRVRSGRSDQDFGDARRVRNQILATIVCCIYDLRSYPYFSVEIAFRNHLSVLRFDMTEYFCLITNEDPEEPGFILPRESPLYRQWQLELEEAWRDANCNRLYLEEATGTPTYDKLTIKRWFSEIGLPADIKLTDEDLVEIIETARIRPDRYAKV